MKIRARAFEFGLYALGPLVALLTTPVLARALGPEQRGALGVVLALSAIGATVGNFGQAETYLSERRRGNPNYLHARTISLAFSLVSALLIFFGSSTLGVDWRAAAVAAVLTPVIVQSNLWRAVVVASGQSAPPALANGLAAVGRLILLPSLALLALLDVFSAVLVTQGALAIAVAVVLLPKARIQIRAENTDLRSGSKRKSIVCGAQIVGFNVLTSITLNSGVLLTLQLASAAEAGIFAACFAISQAALAISAAFKTRIQVAVFDHQAARAVLREFILLFAIGAVGAALLLILASPIAAILFGSEFNGAAAVLRILALGTVGQMVLDSAQGLLVATGHRSGLIVSSAVGAVVTVGLLLTLVPSAQATGAAWAVSVGLSSSALISLSFGVQRLRSETRSGL